MSFSMQIKKELSEINNLANKKEIKYEFLGYLVSGNISNINNKIKYSTENEYNINRFAKLLQNIGIEDFAISIQGKIFNIKFKNKNNLYDKKTICDLIKNADNIEYIKAFIRGIFMGSGSINNPENTYHLEMRVNLEQLAKLLIDIMKKYDIIIKSMKTILYIKDGEEISKFLAFIGGNNSVIKFEEIRVQREMNNKVNRIVNCENANLNRVLNASVKQIDAIKKLKQNGKFQKLDNSLKEIANLRLEYPDMPTEKLGSLLSKPIGKSGVNYRLNKIINLSKD